MDSFGLFTHILYDYFTTASDGMATNELLVNMSEIKAQQNTMQLESGIWFLIYAVHSGDKTTLKIT